MIDAALVDKVGIKAIGQIAKLPKEEARAFIYAEKIGGGELTLSEVEQLISLAKNTAAPEKANYYDRRRKEIAVLWLLGASWQQLADLYQISKPSVIQSGRKYVLLLSNFRLARRCEHGRVAEYHACFWENIDLLMQKDLMEAARWLIANTEVDE